MSARYVVHAGRRFVVTGDTDLDGAPALELPPLGRGARIVARAAECRDDRRRVVIRGYQTHRLARPVVMEVRQEHGETHIELRLKGMRKSFKVSLEGAYDLAARQHAANEQRERQWKREQRRMGRHA